MGYCTGRFYQQILRYNDGKYPSFEKLFKKRIPSMIEVLFGSKNAERVLIYIYSRQEGYAREIARFYNTDLKSIQNQLDKMEAAGILVSREAGRTRPYTFNPRYSLLAELKGLLEKAFSFYPMKLQEELVIRNK